MTLILEKLRTFSINPTALIQKQLFQLPPDLVRFRIERAKALYFFALNDKTSALRRFYLVNEGLAKDLGDAAKLYCFVPFRSQLGPTGIMQVNMLASDKYSISKRQALEADSEVFSVTRLTDAYEFTTFTDHDIEPIGDVELDHMLHLAFAGSIIEHREDPIFKRYFSLPDSEGSEQYNAIIPATIENELITASSSYDDLLNIDINIDSINALL